MILVALGFDGRTFVQRNQQECPVITPYESLLPNGTIEIESEERRDLFPRIGFPQNWGQDAGPNWLNEPLVNRAGNSGDRCV